MMMNFECFIEGERLDSQRAAAAQCALHPGAARLCRHLGRQGRYGMKYEGDYI